MQRKHVVVLASEDLVTGLDDELAALIVEPVAVVVRDGRGFLQDSVRGDHFARHQVLPDAEMLKRTLGLSAPELVGGYFDNAEAVSLSSHLGHGCLLSSERVARATAEKPNAMACPANCQLDATAMRYARNFTTSALISSARVHVMPCEPTGSKGAKQNFVLNGCAPA